MDMRRLLRAAAVLALVPLAGCTLSGEVVVEPEQVRVDLVLTHPDDGGVGGPCRDAGWVPEPLSVAPVSIDEPGVLGCRIIGTYRPETPNQVLGSMVAISDDQAFVRVRPLGRWLGDGAQRLEDVDVTIHLPGEIIATAGGPTVEGWSARWTDADRVRAEGMAATSTIPPLVPWP